MTTFVRASPVSLSLKPLRPDIEATPKTDLSLSRSLVHRQTWRLTGATSVFSFCSGLETQIRDSPHVLSDNRFDHVTTAIFNDFFRSTSMSL